MKIVSLLSLLTSLLILTGCHDDYYGPYNGGYYGGGHEGYEGHHGPSHHDDYEDYDDHY